MRVRTIIAAAILITLLLTPLLAIVVSSFSPAVQL